MQSTGFLLALRSMDGERQGATARCEELVDQRAEAERFLKDRCVRSQLKDGKAHTKTEAEYAQAVIRASLGLRLGYWGKVWLYREAPHTANS